MTTDPMADAVEFALSINPRLKVIRVFGTATVEEKEGEDSADSDMDVADG